MNPEYISTPEYEPTPEELLGNTRTYCYDNSFVPAPPSLEEPTDAHPLTRL